MRPAETLVAVAASGGRLQPAGDRIRALLPVNCPNDLRGEIRQHKAELLALLQRRFLIVHSAVLNETIYFAADEAANTALLNAGAEVGCVYTRGELRLIVDQHRRGSLTPADLLYMHRAKRMFNGQISDASENRP